MAKKPRVAVDLRSVQSTQFTSLCQILQGSDAEPDNDAKNVLMYALGLEREQQNVFLNDDTLDCFTDTRERQSFGREMDEGLKRLAELTKLVASYDEPQASALLGYVKEVTMPSGDNRPIATRCAAVYLRMQAAFRR